MCYSLLYNAPTMLPATGRQHRGWVIPQAVTHSLVLLMMGKLNAQNMLCWLELLNISALMFLLYSLSVLKMFTLSCLILFSPVSLLMLLHVVFISLLEWTIWLLWCNILVVRIIFDKKLLYLNTVPLIVYHYYSCLISNFPSYVCRS